VGKEFLKREGVGEAIYLPDPTWANHKNIFGHRGLQVEYYPYYCAKEHGVNFEKTHAFLSKLKPHSIVLLHACCHNPTGADFSLEEWKRLSELFLQKKLFPFFDCAYQGFGKGIEEDAAAVRLFAKEGHEMIVAVSLSKNFSLYSERVGALFIIGETHKIQERIQSSVHQIIRAIYSNPPFHGAQLVSHILGTHALKKEWESELTAMRERIGEMRNALTKALVAKSKKRDFSYLNNGSGFFCYSGLTLSQVERLTKEYGIYMTSDGRINLAGLNWDNVDYVANAISHETN
jgi:aspartate/tyrosine/aromatic aminotransferase